MSEQKVAPILSIGQAPSRQVDDSPAKKRLTDGPTLDPADRKRLGGQARRILAMLQLAGAEGCTNRELWAVCHAVNSRVGDLRERGYQIISEPEGGGVWRYRLVSTPRRGPSPFMERRRTEEARERAAALPLFAEVSA